MTFMLKHVTLWWTFHQLIWPATCYYRAKSLCKSCTQCFIVGYAKLHMLRRSWIIKISHWNQEMSTTRAE